MMITIPDNPFFIWIQTPDGSVNINEIFRITLVPKGTVYPDPAKPGQHLTTEDEQIGFFFKTGYSLFYSSKDAGYADLKDQLIRSNFMRVGKSKTVLPLIKPGGN